MSKESLSYNEEQLFLLFKTGDEAAFTGIYNRLYKEILFHAKRIVNQLEKAEEITIDAFMKLWEQRDRFGDFISIKRWLYFVVRNAAIDYLRLEKRLSHEKARLLYLTEDNYSDTYFQERATYDLFSRIAASIDQLAPQQKRIFLLFYKEGKSNTEIARELNISVQAVKNTKSKALEILRKTLQEEDLLLILILFKAFL